MEYSTLIILGVVTLLLAILASRLWLLLRTLRQRYAGVTRIQDEIEALRANRDRSKKELQEFETTLQRRKADLLAEHK
jgi:H+/Cl- antiporter ClcA